MSRILAIDIGNTSTLFGHFEGKKLKKTFRVPTKDLMKHNLPRLGKIFRLKNMDAAVIASVVPAAGRFLRSRLANTFKIKTFLIGKDLQVPIVNRYRDPGQVGADRLVNALAAFKKYRRAAILIDFGTAITFDVISKKGEYLGGVIAPGIEISLEALFQKTALLPKIRLKHPRVIIGRDTVESIRIGCSVGIGGLCERIIREIRSRHRQKFYVIATGGYAKFLSKYCRVIDRVDLNLTLEGICITFLKAI